MAAVAEYIGADVLSLLTIPVFIMVRRAHAMPPSSGRVAPGGPRPCARAQNMRACTPAHPAVTASSPGTSPHHPPPSPAPVLVPPSHPKFKEPTTMLQKMSEVLEYAELLDDAAAAADPIERWAAGAEGGGGGAGGDRVAA